MNNLSLEEFENGVKLYQDENLYKFTSDAIKLAKFCKIKPSDNVLDMCAGSGVVGLYAYSIHPFSKIYFNEIQVELSDLINKNIILNNLGDKSSVLCKNLNDLTLKDFDKKLDVIICNPPYFKVNSKIKKDLNIAICRHEIATNLSKIISKASELIKSKGKFYFVIPADRLCEAIILLNNNQFEAKRIEMYYSKDCATICLIESIKDAKTGVKINILKEGL